MEFINLKAQYMYLKDTIDSRIQSVLNEAHFIDGKEVKEFEQNIAKYVGRKHCITCANGTDALMLSFVALGLQKNHVVFCPSMTFIASVEPAILLGAVPIFVDINPNTFNIDPILLEESIKKVISEGKLIPKFIVSVDFLGNPADYDEIEEIAKKYGLHLIEDAAQSIGGSYKNKKCGSFGILSTTSFFPSKPLGCYGDGGAIFTDDDELNILLRSLKSHGKGSSKYDNVRIGFNSRLDTIQAAILNVKLSVLENEISKRQQIASRFKFELSKHFLIQEITNESTSAFAQFVLICKSTEERDLLMESLSQIDIPTIVYYPKPLHKQKAFNIVDDFNLKNSEKYADCNMGIPFSPYLTIDEQDKIIIKIKKFIDVK